MMPSLFKKLKTEARLEKFVLLRAQKVLAQNHENLSYALQVGVLESDTAITPLGVGIVEGLQQCDLSILKKISKLPAFLKKPALILRHITKRA
jgi:hypothetical protein